jgi:tetratricopeptide (TPR) repeat protein
VALGLAERGLELAAEQATRFALLLARGKLLVELGRSGDAIEASRTALAVAASADERARALIAMAAGMRLSDRIAEGLSALDEAEPLAAAAVDLSRLHHLRGNLLFPLGRHAECLREHGLALDHARASGSLEAEAAAIGGLGDGYYLQGRMRSASQQFRECVALARAHGFGRLEVANLSMVGWSAMHLNEVAAAVAVGHEAIGLALQASQPRAELMARTLVGWGDGVIRDRDDAQAQNAEALELIRAVGAKRFEAQVLAMNALMALRRGERGRALEQVEKALSVCRAHGMGHIGPWAYGVRALIERDPGERVRLLEEGERQLALGCVSHNHLELRELAIDARLEIGDWDGVDESCARIRTYTVDEPLPMSEFVIARGTALAQLGRGERSEVLHQALLSLQRDGAHAELNSLLPAIALALHAF